MVNFNVLLNTTPLTINMSLVNDTTTLIPNMITNSNTVTDNYFGLGVMIVLFIVLVYTFYRDDGDIRLDTIRTVLVSSGIVSIIGTIALYAGIFYSFQHIMWFYLIFLVFLIFTMILKRDGS